MEPDTDAIYIPIGMHCKVAVTLRDQNKRNNAYPFDWVFCPMESIYKLCTSEFDGFLDNIWIAEKPIHQTYVKDHGDNYDRIDRDIYPAVDTQYKIILPHSFIERDQSSIDTVKKTFSRRIDRFYQVLSNSDIKKKLVYDFRFPTKQLLSFLNRAGIQKPQQYYCNAAAGKHLNLLKKHFMSTYDNIEFIKLRTSA